MPIQILTANTINKIAAGEVIHRPLSVVKELIENSIDANSDVITIELRRGGRNLIAVSDNGEGMNKEDIVLSIERHATSKLNEKDISNIQYLGFRGEALASITAVSKIRLKSKKKGSEDAWEIYASSDLKSKIIPTYRTEGTTVQVTDLFYTTPNKIRFLKSEASEVAACTELINNFALSRKDIAFKFIHNEKIIIETRKQQRDKSIPLSPDRTIEILGKSFFENSIEFYLNEEETKIYGYTSIPTYNSATSMNQHFFINERFVKDKILISSVRAAYRNFLPSNRFAQIVLYLETNPKMVDVNVHPTKAEVRFKEEQKIKNIVMKALKSSLSNYGLKFNTDLAQKAANVLNLPEDTRSIDYQNNHIPLKNSSIKFRTPSYKEESQLEFDLLNRENTENYWNSQFTQNKVVDQNNLALKKQQETKSLFLGIARCQVNQTYIIAEKDDGLILVDQHAAHERLVLEEMKKQLKDGSLKSQILLIPQIVDLGEVLTHTLLEKKQQLKEFGITLEKNSTSQVIVRQIPALFQGLDINKLIKHISEHIHMFDDINIVYDKIEEILGNISCNSSIKSGRIMNLEEMNYLLREMEKTEFSQQCNHGRPTFVKLSFKDINKIFERI